MYLMESEREAERLEAKTDAAEVRRRLELVGVAPGMRVLDAGAGSGAVSRVLSEMVGSRGEVVALELEPRRAEFIRQRARERGLRNITVVEGDLFDPPAGVSGFDLVWCEFVLEYLENPALATEALAALVGPGGKLAVADLDGNALFHYPQPDLVQRGLEKLARALRGRFDPYAGRKLYSHFRRAGLSEIDVHMLPYHLYGGAAPAQAMENWRAKLETLRPIAVPVMGALPYDQWRGEFLAMLADQEVFTYSVLFVVEGRVR